MFVGFAYGLKGTKIPLSSKIVICIFSVVYSALGLIFGNMLANVLPSNIGEIIGTVFLSLIGIAMIYKALRNQKSKPAKKKQKKDGTIFKIFIKSMGITIQILKNPDKGDFDNSGVIDLKEAFVISLAISVDAICAAIASALIGLNVWYLPFLIGAIQMLFLTIGLFGGKFLKNKFNLKEKYMSILSGAMLLLLSIIKLF
jgi:putative sporulation protein YtaF